MNVYDFVNSINDASKTSLMETGNEFEDVIIEKIYEAYIVNRTLSYFPDTIMYAQEMNINRWLDSKLQYDYLRYSIRPRKRFRRWGKKPGGETLDLIKKHFNYNNHKAAAAIRILTAEQIDEIRELYTGTT